MKFSIVLWSMWKQNISTLKAMYQSQIDVVFQRLWHWQVTDWMQWGYATVRTLRRDLDLWCFVQVVQFFSSGNPDSKFPFLQIPHHFWSYFPRMQVNLPEDTRGEKLSSWNNHEAIEPKMMGKQVSLFLKLKQVISEGGKGTLGSTQHGDKNMTWHNLLSEFLGFRKENGDARYRHWNNSK